MLDRETRPWTLRIDRDFEALPEELRLRLRIRLEQPAARGNTVGNVSKPIRKKRVEFGENHLPDDIAVHGGHPVDRKASHNGQIGHAHALFRVFLDDGQARPALV